MDAIHSATVVPRNLALIHGQSPAGFPHLPDFRQVRGRRYN
jgi:hypothetical protein